VRKLFRAYRRVYSLLKATEVTEKEETIFQVMEIEHEMPV